MSKTLDAQIDALYAVPLSQFVAARTALAKTVTGNEAKRIKALAKPTTLPWVVNQLRWHERARYERVMKTGATMRSAQIAALEGRAAKGAEAASAHRHALTDAVKAATALAASAGVHVDADALQRMLETISTAESLTQTHGRFTEVVQPAGLEALLGIAMKAPVAGGRFTSSAPTPTPAVQGKPGKKPSAPSPAALRLVEREQRARAEAAARRAEAIKAAERTLTKARAKEADALKAWHEARDLADAADRALIELKKSD